MMTHKAEVSQRGTATSSAANKKSPEAPSGLTKTE